MNQANDNIKFRIPLTPNNITFTMDYGQTEVMRITSTGIWVNPDISVDEIGQAVLNAIDSQVKIMVQRAVEDEREACANVCAKMWHEWLDSPTENEINKPDAEDCADAIRARGEK